jgi:hypothetical protein
MVKGLGFYFAHEVSIINRMINNESRQPFFPDDPGRDRLLGVCFWWMRRLSIKQNALLDQLREQGTHRKIVPNRA